jgi:hypothetical protein
MADACRSIFAGFVNPAVKVDPARTERAFLRAKRTNHAIRNQGSPEAHQCKPGLMLKMGNKPWLAKLSNLIVFERLHANFFDVCDKIHGLE